MSVAPLSPSTDIPRRWALSPLWRRRLLNAVGVVLLIALMLHPELRLLAPVVDSMGLDLFAVLIGSQLLMHARVLLAWARPVLVPLKGLMCSPQDRVLWQLILEQAQDFATRTRQLRLPFLG